MIEAQVGGGGRPAMDPATGGPRSRTPRADASAAVVALAILVALARVASGTAPWVPVLDAAWGLACVSAMGVGIRRHRERGRLAWGLFSASVVFGAFSMAVYPMAGSSPAVAGVRDLLDLGAYVTGAAGILAFSRAFGATDPDAWLDSAAVGLALGLLMFEFVLEHHDGALQTGRGVAFSVVVAIVDALVVTVIARFAIRPIASPGLSLLGAIIAAVLVVDIAYYGRAPFERPIYEAMWMLAYGAWAAASLHPGTAELVSRSRATLRTGLTESRAALIAIGVHVFGAAALMASFGNHMTEAPTENLGVFAGAFVIQISIVAGRAARLALRLRDDDRRRRIAERALRASEERFRRLADVAPVGIFVADLDGRSTFQNAAWAELAGIPAAAGTGSGFEAAIHPDDRAWAMERWMATVAGREPFDIEHRILRPDGSIRWVHATATPLGDPEGRATGWVGTVADITALVTARAAAVERAAFIDALIEQAPVGIEVYDRDGRSTSANRAQRAQRTRLAGAAAAVADVRTDPLMLRLGQRGPIMAAFDGRAGGDRDPVRIEVPGADGGVEERFVRMTWFPLLEASGEVSAVISFLEDVTGPVLAETERRAVEAKLQEAAKLEALGVLAGGIAHDFNNLLVAILGHASIARSQLAPGSPLDADLASVETAARRAADLARQMLAYSGRSSFRVGALSVEGLLREMADLLARSISKGASLVTEFTPGLPPVHADATQLRQVALNLIVNASDALEGRPGTITLRTARATVDPDDPDIVPGFVAVPGEYVLLEVADTGRGMDPATLARIFDPFFTTKATGRGLGLAATLGIVKGHGGVIRVRSEPGIGTLVGVLLRPALAGEEADQAEPGPTGVASSVPATGPGGPVTGPGGLERSAAEGATAEPGGRVLLVDDEPTVRLLGSRVLERAGYTVVEAPDGPDGIAAFASDPPSWSVVLLDLTLPTLDGMAVLAELRRLRPGIPAVICSGWAAEEVTARLAETRGTLVLEKPYSPADLLEAIRAAVALPPVEGGVAGEEAATTR